MLKETTVFNVSFHLRAIFLVSFGNSMILPAALPCRSLSHILWLVGVVFGQCCCRGCASFSAHFWTSGIYFYVYFVGSATIRTIGRRVEYVDNHQNYRSKSGICCRVQTSFLRVVGCCCINVHVPTSFCCCEIQAVVLGDETCQSVFFMKLPRGCFVLHCKTVEHRSRKSRDLLQTGKFTSGDKITHFCFCRDSFQCCCMRTVAHLFLRVSSISAHGSGRDSYSRRCV